MKTENNTHINASHAREITNDAIKNFWNLSVNKLFETERFQKFFDVIFTSIQKRAEDGYFYTELYFHDHIQDIGYGEKTLVEFYFKGLGYDALFEGYVFYLKWKP